MAACGGLNRTPQPADGVTYAHKIEKAESNIDWSESAEVIARRLRAFNPFPGGATHLGAEAIKVWEAAAEQGTGAAGTVLSANAQGVRVACGSGVLNMTLLQRAGGKRLAAGISCVASSCLWDLCWARTRYDWRRFDAEPACKIDSPRPFFWIGSKEMGARRWVLRPGVLSPAWPWSKAVCPCRWRCSWDSPPMQAVPSWRCFLDCGGSAAVGNLVHGHLRQSALCDSVQHVAQLFLAPESATPSGGGLFQRRCDFCELHAPLSRSPAAT